MTLLYVLSKTVIYAVALLKDGNIVGHVPKENAKVYKFFLKRGGKITAKVIGKRQNAGLEKGLEIPVEYTFSGCKKDTILLTKLLKK
jgi:hypothetical protein